MLGEKLTELVSFIGENKAEALSVHSAIESDFHVCHLNRKCLGFCMRSRCAYHGEDEAAQPPERKRTERNNAYRVYEEIIKDNIAYDILLQDRSLDRDRLNEIVDLMLETVCTARKTIRIAGDDYPAELVKSKFMKLNSEHIRFVLDCMQENTTKIRNIKQYLKAVLFNAPSTIDSYYTSLVAHDMASGALAPRKPKYGDLDYYTYNEGESL